MPLALLDKESSQVLELALAQARYLSLQEAGMSELALSLVEITLTGQPQPHFPDLHVPRE